MIYKHKKINLKQIKNFNFFSKTFLKLKYKQGKSQIFYI